MARIFASDGKSKQLKSSQTKAAAGHSDLQTAADASDASAQLTQLQALADAPVQCMEEEELMQGKFAEPAQLMEEEEMLQGKFDAPVQRMEEVELMQGKFDHPAQRKENQTGMPDSLKSGVENLSGVAMDDVRVHYNSGSPAQLNAHAYAQGTDIHLGPGQERHLPHEAWHVAQQAQGRVQPTTEVGGQAVNDSPALEQEADQMGTKASGG